MSKMDFTCRTCKKAPTCNLYKEAIKCGVILTCTTDYEPKEERMDERERTKAFLDELANLTEKYGLAVLGTIEDDFIDDDFYLYDLNKKDCITDGEIYASFHWDEEEKKYK